ncbi:MAG: hypothetical protein WCK86_17125 [Planctomycetia bacterium]
MTTAPSGAAIRRISGKPALQTKQQQRHGQESNTVPQAFRGGLHGPTAQFVYRPLGPTPIAVKSDDCGSSGYRESTALTDRRVVQFHGLYIAAMAVWTLAVVMDQPRTINSRHKATGENYGPAGPIKRDDMLRLKFDWLRRADVFKF